MGGGDVGKNVHDTVQDDFGPLGLENVLSRVEGATMRTYRDHVYIPRPCVHPATRSKLSVVFAIGLCELEAFIRLMNILA